MKRKDVGKGVVIFLVVAMLFLMTAASLAANSSTLSFGNNSAGEKLDLLVGFHGPPNPGLVRAFGGEIYAEFTLVDVIAARMTEQQARALQKNPSISYIEPDGLVYAIGQEVPWGINRVFGNENYPFPTWGTSSGGGIGVAVLDTGIDTNHEDLTVAGGRRFYVQGIFLREDDQYNDGHGHGTHVAGTIAALDNKLGVVGVAPDVDLYAVKVLTDSGSGSVSAIVKGIEWTVNHGGISIINMSLGSSSYSQTFENACNTAYAEGLLVVSSAGNSGDADGTGDTVGYPAKYKSVIAVAASDNTDKRASFSSTGPDVELIAPGRYVYSTVPGGYATYSGTSMASPHVAGVAALVWATDETLTNVEVREILRSTAEDLRLDSWHQGHGLVQADLAVKDTGAGPGPEPPPSTYQLTLDVEPVGGGTAYDETGGGYYEAGAEISIGAFAASGFEFVKWSALAGEFADANNSATTFTMPSENVTVTANFKKIAVTETLYTSVATDKPEYKWNSWVYITVTVKDQSNPGIAGASASVTVIYPNGGEAAKYNGTTDSSGTVVFSYRVPNKALTGEYTVEAQAFMDELSSDVGTTTFNVKSR